ncbi:MAG TPA: RNA polymerase sigma factor [Prolixibacteraceae bacterium]|nr:RNA polymerase sigma factor [Prolixibacteraceae bacterium]
MTEQEFKIQVLPFAKIVFPLAKRMLASDDRARDAIQQSMLKLWEKRKQLKDCAHLKAFVFRVVKNTCLDELKRKKTVGLESSNLLYVPVDSHEKQVEVQETFNMVLKAIGELPQAQAEVIQLRDIDGLTFAEIASIVGSDEAYVRVLLSRARKAIRTKIEKMNAYESKQE